LSRCQKAKPQERCMIVMETIAGPGNSTDHFSAAG
jgi:hypothetical protein